MAEAAGGGPLLPEELVIWEILTRLPAKPLLRCRAVCLSWRRRLTSDAKFLLAHHRRQPSLPLLTQGDRSTEDRRIDALDYRTGERLPVARTTGRTAANADDLNVLASCDGLLVLIANGGLHICNPATRQRAPLALLHGASCISALYPYRPSGSYRVAGALLLRESRGRPRRVPRAHRRVARAQVRRRTSRAVGVRRRGDGDADDVVLSPARRGRQQDLLAAGKAARRQREGQQHARVRYSDRVLPATAVAPARGGPLP
ncbi:uncharacterized protein LOC100304338 [Zea mays]|uniref:Ethylene-responsive protein n=1 Tax=Zea mays TaxID=4577 RepID=C0HEX3_MAIZE|nr:uncharacterized protein LOC100304338 [Zea mays]ACN25576.1 unknown [Zea mays]ONM39445.1 Ethylene-responsive protein [Zea mays]|eukprot:NP_001159248.1 uncharacterized protein LOC100304338 [Zea mays]